MEVKFKRLKTDIRGKKILGLYIIEVCKNIIQGYFKKGVFIYHAIYNG